MGYWSFEMDGWLARSLLMIDLIVLTKSQLSRYTDTNL